jgi:hypothetical protein
MVEVVWIVELETLTVEEEKWNSSIAPLKKKHVEIEIMQEWNAVSIH